MAGLTASGASSIGRWPQWSISLTGAVGWRAAMAACSGARPKLSSAPQIRRAGTFRSASTAAWSGRPSPASIWRSKAPMSCRATMARTGPARALVGQVLGGQQHRGEAVGQGRHALLTGQGQKAVAAAGLGLAGLASRLGQGIGADQAKPREPLRRQPRRLQRHAPAHRVARQGEPRRAPGPAAPAPSPSGSAPRRSGRRRTSISPAKAGGLRGPDGLVAQHAGGQDQGGTGAGRGVGTRRPDIMRSGNSLLEIVYRGPGS